MPPIGYNVLPFMQCDLLADCSSYIYISVPKRASSSWEITKFLIIENKSRFSFRAIHAALYKYVGSILLYAFHTVVLNFITLQFCGFVFDGGNQGT